MGPLNFQFIWSFSVSSWFIIASLWYPYRLKITWAPHHLKVCKSGCCIATHTLSFHLAAPKSERPLDKSKISIKTAGLQRSRSDAGRDHHHGEHRKPPSGLVKPSAGASFGYKKPPTATGTATVMTAGGTTISSGSATVGKTPKSSGIPVKPVGGGVPTGRKNSFDASSEQSFLGPNARNSIQYRSLPRPAKSSTLSVIGRPASRPVSGTIDQGLLSLKPVPVASTGPRVKEMSSCGAKMTSRTSLGPVNQTDREKEKERAKAKAVGADIDCGSLKGEETQSSEVSAVKLHGLRRTSSSKYPELSSPTTPRSLRCCIRVTKHIFLIRPGPWAVSFFTILQRYLISCLDPWVRRSNTTRAHD